MDTPRPQSSSFPDPVSYEPYYNAQTVVKSPATPQGHTPQQSSESSSQSTPELTHRQEEPAKVQQAPQKSPQEVLDSLAASFKAESAAIQPPQTEKTSLSINQGQPQAPLPKPQEIHQVKQVAQSTAPQQKSFPFMMFTIASVVLIVLIGGGIAASTFLNQQAQKTVTPLVPTKAVVQTPVITNAPVASSSAVPLTLLTPQNADVTSSPQITLSGKTTPLSSVIIFTDRDQQEVEATQTGEFTANVTLAKGLNKISAVTMTKNGSTLVERYVINE